MTITNCDLITDIFLEHKFRNISLLITYISVSVWKSSSFNILSWKSDSISFVEKRTECETLHCCPIEWLIIIEIFNSFFVDFSYSWMKIEVLWPGCNFFKNGSKIGSSYTSFGSPEGGWFQVIEFIWGFRLRWMLIIQHFLVSFLIFFQIEIFTIIHLFQSQDSLTN